MTHFASISDDHPVAQWQAEKSSKEFPELTFKVVSRFDDAYGRLSELGFDTKLHTVDFDNHWLTPDASFDEILKELRVDSCKYQCSS